MIISKRIGEFDEGMNALGNTTPHPWSLYPLRGEGKAAARAVTRTGCCKVKGVL